MKKVLVADDTKNIRTLLTTCLELEGYQVVTAIDGNQAFALFGSNAFDLAFIDIKMPEMSGTEVLRRIREMGVKTPVIIMTAFATVKNAVECTRLGAVAYLQKPFTADKIRTVLAELAIAGCSNCCGNAEDCAEIKNVLKQSEKLIEAGSFEKALELLKRVLPQCIENADVYRHIGLAYEGMGDKKNADKFYATYRLFCDNDTFEKEG